MNRAWTGLGVALFVGACLAWLAWTPYSPERVLRVIPAHSRVISAHHALGTRWPALMANPLLADGLSSGAIGSEAAASGALARLLRHAAARCAFTAWVPHLGPHGEPAWVAASWVGARGHLARWWLRWTRPQGLTRHEPFAGRVYWTLDRPLQGRRLAFALEDGVLVAAWARRHQALAELFATADGRLPSLGAGGLTPADRSWLLQSAPPDRAWVRTPRQAQERWMDPLRIEILACDADGLTGTLQWPAPAAPPVSFPSAPASEAPWGDLPLGSAYVRRSFLEQMLQPWADQAWAPELSGLLDRLGASYLQVGLFGEELGGRLRGLRVPAAVAAVPVTTPGSGLQGMADTLPRWRRGNGFTPMLVPVAGRPDWRRIDDAASRSTYGRLPAHEKGVAAEWGGWLLVATHPAPLQAIRRQAPAPVLLPDDAGESRPTPPEPGAASAGQLDLRRGGKALRNGLAVWSLALLADGRTAGSPLPRRLERARRILEAAEPLGRLTWTAVTGPDTVLVEIRIGHDA